MRPWDGLTGGQVGWLAAALVVAVVVGVGLLVAVGAAEVRSRRGAAERVAAIRLRLVEARRQTRRQIGVRS